MIRKLRLNTTYTLIAGAICLLLISYQLALKNTLEAWQLNKKLNAQVNKVTIAEQPAYLERQDKALAAIIKAYQTDTVNYRNTIVSQISEIGDKEHVRIVEVPTQTNFSTGQYLVQKINLKGDFFALLRTLNHLQELNGIGYVRSVLLKKNANPNRMKEDKEVLLDLYLEVIKQRDF
ncbi:hypothetical protein [Mucilaginibacter polytrichastri]|uniref:Uncharacterized protein n=1 Tax=Mucilaginibacter polytrichastri TaxID=1302689 RepID=A0A1Q5ZZW2_9SPHI|nr:hypothetical protein [Mucilaginibacter polytrichastri]OKS87288.1 hypothetical protein RG47T_2747 [Mucilaginibacter polytrichastri]SFT18484.1 hypothetical protein SAMN04487890_11512 [Mucilaginibacter polytrichastri]